MEKSNKHEQNLQNPFTSCSSPLPINAGIGNSAKDTIKGLLCQTRVGETPVGAFDVPPNNNYIQKLDCGNSKAVSVGAIARAP